jgi:hypothetical protein
VVFPTDVKLDSASDSSLMSVKSAIKYGIRYNTDASSAQSLSGSIGVGISEPVVVILGHGRARPASTPDTGSTSDAFEVVVQFLVINTDQEGTIDLGNLLGTDVLGAAHGAIHITSHPFFTYMPDHMQTHLSPTQRERMVRLPAILETSGTLTAQHVTLMIGAGRGNPPSKGGQQGGGGHPGSRHGAASPTAEGDEDLQPLLIPVDMKALRQALPRDLGLAYAHAFHQLQQAIDALGLDWTRTATLNHTTLGAAM